MYRYDEFDHTFVKERVAEFRDQVERRVSGALTEEQFRPLRLMNGLYLQLHAYMLRVAIPYGTLSSDQLRKLAHVAQKYDKGYAHFTTRQNVQYNWPKLHEVPDILDDLAEVEMHAIQTSGNCIRNVTTDQFAGVAGDEIEDPRIYAEIIRQWSTLHPEFTYLPRKFKIAITGATNDRAAIRFHDIGIRMVRNETGEPGFQIWVGGGLGRTPIVGKIVRDFLPKLDLLSYLESILRVYNRYGRRDNKYKARIKILVNEIGLETFRDQVEEEWRSSHGFAPELPYGEIERIMDYFDPPSYKDVPSATATLQAYGKENPEFARFLANNVMTHKQEGYAAITISLKPVGGIPGDASAAQMNAVAAIADQYGFGEIRVTHEQNLVLPDIAQQDLIAVFEALQQHDLAIANVGEATDMICCPGLDYCNLANARSIPIAQDIAKHLNDKGLDKDAGKLTINISGCINACGHHHVANIGILGVDKRGAESYQVTLGGAPDEDAAVGKLIGPGFSADDIVPAIDTIVSVYTQQRQTNETFLQTYRRIGAAPFKEALYD